MSRTPGLVASLSLLLLPLGCGAGSASVSTSTGAEASAATAETPAPPAEQTPKDTQAAAPNQDDAGKTGGDAGNANATEAPPEPAWADHTREVLRGAEAPENPLGVSMIVHHSGAELPWTVLIANTSNRDVELVADVRLLELEIQKPAPEASERSTKAPPAPKPEKCQLPDSERPKSADEELTLALAPGTMAVYRFDPRLICDEDVLVPGAVVTPSFGWELKTKTVWKGGKKEEVVLPQEAPFVARLPGKSPEPSTDAPEPLKRLTGPAFTLDDSYAPPPVLDDAPKDSEGPPPLQLSVKPLGSAKDMRNETVTVDIKNPASVGRYLFIRRELITYEIVGPAGASSCISYPDQRAPARASFEYLSPGRVLTLTSRLPEMCPPGTFDISGIYRVHARLDATERGDDYDLDAFVGVITSKKPGIFRMRGGKPPHMLVLPIQAAAR